MADNNILQFPGSQPKTNAKIIPFQDGNDGHDRGESSNDPAEQRNQQEARTPEDLEPDADQVREAQLAFEKTPLKGDEDHLFNGEKRVNREEQYSYVDRTPPIESSTDARKRIKEKIRILLIQSLDAVLQTKKKFPEIIAEVPRALALDSVREAREKVEGIGEHLDEVQDQLRRVAHVYFTKSYGLMREFQKTYPDEFEEVMRDAFDEYYLKYGHLSSDQPNAKYFASTFFNDFMKVTAGESLEDLHEQVGKLLSVFDRVKNDELTPDQRDEVQTISDDIEIIAQNTQEVEAVDDNQNASPEEYTSQAA